MVWQVPTEIDFTSDPALLLLVFRNLFSNALSYGFADHPILIECKSDRMIDFKMTR